MIDNPDQAERLFARLQAVLPLPARVTPELAATLQTKNTATETPTTCSITWRRPDIRNLGSCGL